MDSPLGIVAFFDVLTSTTARAIEDQLLKDFGNKSEFSDWFSREDEPQAAGAKKPVVSKPNPRNVEHEKRIAELEASIKRYAVQAICRHHDWLTNWTG